MIRYQVRNEYGLADPVLYAPEEKDDPEALLEGVAMAGLVGVLRQLGDLAEFAAEIFHDLHEDVMAAASRGHGLMLRVQQLEAEFPAVEKAIIVSQTDHLNYLHDDGIEWHTNLQLNQNLITIGDMPRFILDSYEECRGPPHLFTLDKFDVAGAGASLKRYSDPSFFKMGQTSSMIETDYFREKNPRKLKKKAMRRKGETLESLLVANSESQITSPKDRSRKVPPRTTKLKPRHPQTISRICREQLEEVISSQQKILSNYSARYYHENFRSSDSSEIISSCGELDNFSAATRSSAKLELTKVVPIDESDTLVTASAPTNGSVFLEVDDGQFLATQREHAEMEQICKGSLVEQNDIFSTLGRLQGGTDFKDEESNCQLQSVREEKLQSAVAPVNHDDGRCWPDEVGSDQDRFIDAANTESEGEADHDMESKRDLSTKMEASKLNYHGKEVETAVHVQISDIHKESMLQPAILQQPTKIESSGETFGGNHDIQYIPSTHYPEESFCQEELPEETTLSAEVPCQCDLNKDVVVSMNTNVVGEQPSHDQDLLSELSAQESFATNPFVDPGYRVSSTDPSPGMSYQPYCSEEEQDFLSELLIQHGHMKAEENRYPLNDDSLWESATPPDEAPLPSEVMTEQEFGSFCHEYHEMDFTTAKEGFDDEPSSDSNDITNGCVASVLDFPGSVSALLTELDQKADCHKPDSQLAECSPAGDIPVETSMPFSAREVPDGTTPGADSGLSSDESLHDEESLELITPSVPVKIEQERHALHGVVSDKGTGLLDNEKFGKICGSPSGEVVSVKEEQETCANLVPRVVTNKNLDALDVHFINSLPLEPAVGARGLDELNVFPLSKPVLTHESDVRVLDELDSQTVPSSSIDKTVEDPDVPRLRSAPCPLNNYEVGELDGTPPSNLQVEADNGSYYSPESDSRIAPYSSVNCIEVEQGWEVCASPELDTPPPSNDLLVEKEAEVCVPGELDSEITSCSLPDEKIDELGNSPLSGSTLVEDESEDHVSSDSDSKIAPYSSVNDKIVGSGAATDVELGWEACSSPDLDSQSVPLVNYKVGELDGTLLPNVQVEAENGSYYSPEFDSRIAPYSSVNGIEVEQGWEPCAPPELDFQIAPCPLSEDTRELDGPLSSNVQVEAENRSYYPPEFDSRIAPYSSVDDKIYGHGAAASINDIEVEGWEACASPEFGSQIAPDSSNSGALAERSTMASTSVMPEENCWHSPVPPQTKPLQNESSEDAEKPPPLPPLQWRLGRPRLGLLSTKDRMPDPLTRTSSLPALSQDIDNSLGSLDRMAEPTASVSSQDIKERYQSSMVDYNDERVESGKSSTLPTVDDVAREHDGPFSEACGNIKHEEDITSSPTEAEEHQDDSGVTEHVTNQQDPQQHLLCSDISDITERLSHTDPTASEDGKTVDDHNAAGSVHLQTVSSSAPGRVSENGSNQEPQHGESFSGTSDNEEHSSNALYEQNNLKYQSSVTSGVPSDTTKHTGSSSALEGGNSQKSQLHEHDSENREGGLFEDPSPSAEQTVSEDYPHDDHNMGREIIHQPDLSGQSNTSKYFGGLGEGSYAQAEQPPVMGWTVGPQMLHPNYGVPMEGIQFEPEVTDHRLIRKPISMRNIPRNPLVDAVAAHDRSTMRKVSELASTTDKPNTNDRNLWLEQIRNKTFDLKPVGSAKPASMRAPTGNLRVAAIIEKANAIRQAVGSDDEDDDNWSDT